MSATRLSEKTGSPRPRRVQTVDSPVVLIIALFNFAFLPPKDLLWIPPTSVKGLVFSADPKGQNGVLPPAGLPSKHTPNSAVLMPETTTSPRETRRKTRPRPTTW